MADDILNTLKGLLGDNAEEKIQSVLSALGNSEASPIDSDSFSVPENFSGPSPSSDILNSAGGLKNILDSMGTPNDSRTNLLMSLRPYMRSERQQSIDSAIRLLNISKFSGLFKL